MKTLLMMALILLAGFGYSCSNTKASDSTTVQTNEPEDYNNDNLRYVTSYDFNTATENVQRLYAPLQWTPVHKLKGTSKATFNKENRIAAIHRTPVRNTDAFRLALLSRADSLRLKHQIGDFRLIGVFNNMRYRAPEYYVLFYRNIMNNDFMLQNHDLRIGNIRGIHLFMRDSVNYLEGDKAFIDQAAGRNFYYEGGEAIDVTVSAGSSRAQFEINKVLHDTAVTTGKGDPLIETEIMMVESDYTGERVTNIVIDSKGDTVFNTGPVFTPRTKLSVDKHGNYIKPDTAFSPAKQSPGVKPKK